MKVALFFGSFSPIHNYHIAIANHVIEHENFDSVIFVISPQSPFKTDLVSFKHRYRMCEKAIKDYSKMGMSIVEQDMPLPSYTIDTMNLFSQVDGVEYTIIMGLDNWLEIHKWKEYQEIVTKYAILVIPRTSGNIEGCEDFFYSEFHELRILQKLQVHGDTRMIRDMPLSELSSSFIRNEIKNSKNVGPYITKEVNTYINHYNLYK